MAEEENVEQENEEEAMESDNNSSNERDDCEVFVEEMAGYREYEPVLRSNDCEYVDVPILEDDLSREAGCEDVDGDYMDGDAASDDIWNDDHIPDPLSDDDRQDEEEGRKFN